MRIKYLSHGIVETGGYRHELFFSRQLCNYFSSENKPCSLEVIRYERIFRGLQHAALQYRAFAEANADFNVVVVRMAVAAMLRNVFTKRHVICIFHHTDETAMTKSLRLYFRFLLFLIRLFPGNRFHAVTVSSFQKEVLERRTGKPVFVFPNFMDSDFLLKYRTSQKQKRIHLGQCSEKNHPDIYALSDTLSSLGYETYFSSLKPVPAAGKSYKVLCFDSYETYVEHMAASLFTIAFTGMHEGWNRLVHESILCGTTVIGYAKGGLGVQLQEANMFIVESPEAALQIIQSGETREAPASFIEKYNTERAAETMAAFVKSISVN